MNCATVDAIARAVLYEGYMLYPYRPSVKSHQRWTFGGIFPQAFCAHSATGDASMMQAQVLFNADASATLRISLKFLHVVERTTPLPLSTVENWQEAIEREVSLDDLAPAELTRSARTVPFAFEHQCTVEVFPEAGKTTGPVTREQQALRGEMELSCQSQPDGLTQLTVRVKNLSSVELGINRDAALLRSFASSHLVLSLTSGAFLSLTDPPPPARHLAALCENVGCWPVLVGEPRQTDTLLASPIILPDYPEIAPESPGDLFDGTENDEILTLRILTLTDEEKRQAAAVDHRVHTLLRRTEGLVREQLMNLHGTIRGLRAAKEGTRHG